MIDGATLERGIRQAMAREDVPSLSALARASRIRRDTIYGWFAKTPARLAPASVDKLVSVLGSKPGDPWYDEPPERTLDPETVALIESAVERAVGRLADRLTELLDDRLGPRNAPRGA